LTLAPALAWSLTEILANPPARRFAVAASLLAFLSLAAVVAALRSMPARS
jgi:cyanate permease